MARVNFPLKGFLSADGQKFVVVGQLVILWTRTGGPWYLTEAEPLPLAK